MSYSDMSLTEKLSRTQELSSGRAQILKKSYLLLSIAVMAMMIGGKIGMNTPVILNLFNGWLGWILAMVALNFVPLFALKFRHHAFLGTLGIFLDGLVAGMVIAPMLYIGEMVSGTKIVTTAAWVTFAIFAAVTGSVYFSGLRWAPKRAIFTGLFFAIVASIILNFFIQISFLSIIIAMGIGVFGVLALVSATSDVLHNPDLDSPVPGALMLFSGIFMIFQAVFHLLLAFSGGDD